jgi:AcrR family transcriptional regulator
VGASARTATSQAVAARGRVERRRIGRTEQILDTTAAVVAERGYHDAGLDLIAERLDLATATLYHYFAGKDDLITACLDWVARRVDERMAQAELGPAASAADQLTALVRAQLDTLVQRHRELARLFLDPLEWPEPHREHVKRLRQQHDQRFRSVLERGIASGEFAVPDAGAAMHCLHGAMNYVPLWFRARHGEDYEALYATMSTLLLRLVTSAA